jgi:hypothetical protein
MTFVFSFADRRMFKTAQKILGGPPGGVLESRLGDGVFGDHCQGPDSSAQIWERIDEFFLRRAGSDELSLLRDCLDTGELPSATVLRSLRASLLGPGHPGLDLQLKAGLHRLGRAVADLESSTLSRIMTHLPGAWGRCAQAAWFRLSREEECRASALSLREFLAFGGAS